MNTEIIKRRLPVGMLKPAEYNPRKDLKPGQTAYEKIKRSLTDFGYADPIVWNEVTGNIVGGHQRLKVLMNEGATEVDCIVVHIENPNDEKALNIALNKAVGEWEPVALADLLQDLQLSGYDIDATGFDAAEVDDLFSQVHDKDVHDDETVPDPDDVDVAVKRGDIWYLGKHILMCGDSTNVDDVALLMDKKRANLMVTDVPECTDEQAYKTLGSTFRNAAAQMAAGGSAYIFHRDEHGLAVRQAFKDAGFHISGVCIWINNAMSFGDTPYQWGHESILYGWMNTGTHRWFSDRKQTTVWEYAQPPKKEGEPETGKPVPLLAYPIKNSSAPNGVVLDLFGGYGSVLIACEQTDRICRIMEADEGKASYIVTRYITYKGGDCSGIKYKRNEMTIAYKSKNATEEGGVRDGYKGQEAATNSD